MIRFFINRPIFAIVIALLTILVGVISILLLPIAQYPQIVPPQVVVSSSYVGASAETVAKQVTTPLERSINGVQGMTYINSASTNNGDSVITITFGVGYNLDIAAVDVLNRVNTASPQLPEIVLRSGIDIQKVSSNLLLVVNLLSPDGRYSSDFLSNYADIHITDPLSRTPGVGKVSNFGLHKYSMRIWLDPDKMADLGISTNEVINAIEEQNVQAAAGIIGAPPAPKGQIFQYQINTKGRLEQVKEFNDIIVRAEKSGKLVHIKDIGRAELGAQDYSSDSNFNLQATAALGVYQYPGANAIQLSSQVHKLMKDLAKSFPKGMTYKIAYDTTKFVRESLLEVIKTLFEAIVLVFIVVFIFLQNWRATIIPSIAIPVSLIGAFFLLLLFGFSINTLSLLGLVLAIGLVVDDAIVVVENVVRLMETGEHTLKEATLIAMNEVRGPIVTTTLVLIAVFVPVAFIPDLTGRLYNQFALTIAFAVGLSGINSLTLSPALCASFLKVTKKPAILPFRIFNKGFEKMAHAYRDFIPTLAKFWYLVLLIFLLLGALAGLLFFILPTAFVPNEDQGYFIVAVQTPPGSALQRTVEATRKAQSILLKIKGVENTVGISGFNIIDGVDQPNTGVIFAVLEPWSKRKAPDLHVDALVAQAQRQLYQIQDALIVAFNPSPIPGLGTTSGFTFELQDRSFQGPMALADATERLILAALQRPELANLFTTYTVNVPQVYVDLDRTKAKSLGVSISNALRAMQVYLGSLYINDFNKFGQTYRVIVQAEKNARSKISDIPKLYVENNEGSMVPLSALVAVKKITGPFNVPRYNLYDSALINGTAAIGYSSGEAIAAMEQLAAQVLPSGMGYEWTGLTYQQIKAGNIAAFIFLLSLVFVFLFLSALYESWSMPFMIILAVPLALLGALLALWLRKLQLDIYAQIGLVMLIGLAAKNAILIVEFAKQHRAHGESILQSAMSAAKLRLRPILMTAFAFIFGVMPLVVATGAGAASRHSLGTTVVGGMLASTILSLLIVPVFYIVIENLREHLISKKKVVTGKGIVD